MCLLASSITRPPTHTCGAVESYGMPVLRRQQAQHAVDPVPRVLEEQLAKNEDDTGSSETASSKRDIGASLNRQVSRSMLPPFQALAR